MRIGMSKCIPVFKLNSMRPVICLVLFLFCCFATLASDAEMAADVPVAVEAAEPDTMAPDSSRPVIDLEQLRVLELDQDEFNWSQDWWKYLIMASLLLLCLCLTTYLTKLLFWLFGVLVCLGSALAGGVFLPGLFRPWLPPLLPQSLTDFLPADFICHLLAGCLGYALAACILTILTKPLRRKAKND